MNERITTSELTELLAEKMQMTNEESSTFVKQIFALVFEVLQDDKYLKIKGLGTFKLISVSDRESVDVNTGERILIEGYDKISFTPESALRDLVNKPFAHFDTVVLNEGVEFGEEEVSEGVVEEDEESIVVPGKKAVKSSLKTKEEQNIIENSGKKENPKKVSPKVEIQEGIAPEEENVSDQERKESEKRKRILIPKEEILVEEIVKVEEIHQRETIEMVSIKTEESFLSETMEDTDGKREQPLAAISGEEQISVLKEENAEVVKNIILPENTITGKEQIVFETKEDKVDKQPEDLNADSENEENRIYGQLEDTPPLVIVRKNYMIPFYVCLSFLLILIVSIAVIFSTSPQWFKDLLHIEGQTITIVTVDSEKAIKKAETKIEKEIEKQPVQPKTSGEETALSTKKPVEKQEKNTLWITEKHVNPNDFKIVGTLAVVTLQSGNSLVKLSKQYYGTKDLWTLIVSYNKDVIRDPDHIPVGSSLKIPKLEKK